MATIRNTKYGNWFKETLATFVWDTITEGDPPWPLPGASDTVVVVPGAGDLLFFGLDRQNVTVEDAVTISALTVQGWLYGVRPAVLTVTGNVVATDAAADLDTPISVGGNLSVATQANTDALREDITLTGPEVTVSLGGVPLGHSGVGSTEYGLYVANAGATGAGVTFAEGLDRLDMDDPRDGAITMITAGAKFTLASASTNNLGHYTQSNGTCVDNGATVNVNGNLLITGGTLTSTGTWNLAASANISNATAANKIATFGVNAGVTATLTDDFHAGKLTGSGTIVLAGYGLTVTTWQYTGALTVSATGNLPAVPQAYPVGSVTISAGATATLTGNLYAVACTNGGTLTKGAYNLYLPASATGANGVRYKPLWGAGSSFAGVHGVHFRPNVNVAA
jgi:hypothetical protein